jgi:hypothetical protein
MSGFGIVAAEVVSDEGLRGGGDPGSPLPEEFAQRAEMGIARALGFSRTFHSRALEVLYDQTILFEGFRDGRAPEVHAALGLQTGQERLINVVPSLREVRRRLLLSLTRAEGEQDQDQSQAPDQGNQDLVHHGVLGQCDLRPMHYSIQFSGNANEHCSLDLTCCFQT